MKNVFAIILVMLCLAGILAGCGNKSFIDTTYTFDYAYVELPNGTVVEGKVQSWKDFDDGDQIQANSTRVVMVAK